MRGKSPGEAAVIPLGSSARIPGGVLGLMGRGGGAVRQCPQSLKGFRQETSTWVGPGQERRTGGVC